MTQKATAIRPTIPVRFEVGDAVVEKMGTGAGAVEEHTTIELLTGDSTVRTATGREYDRTTGAAVPRLKSGYRAIHSTRYTHENPSTVDVMWETAGKKTK